MERTLLQRAHSGVSLDGKRFFYPNPLESNGQHERSPWFGVACCPGNITRFLASVPVMCSTQGDTIYVNLFAGGNAESGNGPEAPCEARAGHPLPLGRRCEDHRFSDRPADIRHQAAHPRWARTDACRAICIGLPTRRGRRVSLKVNGRRVALALEKGLRDHRPRLKAGDVISSVCQCQVRRIVAHESVEADRGRVALQRGPIVYAAEWPDNPNGHVRNIVFARRRNADDRVPIGLLNGVQVVRGRASALPTTRKAA